MGFALIDAETYGLFLESVFYGIYLVTCGFCIPALFVHEDRLKRLRDLNWPMVLVGFFMFSIATVDVVLQFYRNLHTFRISNTQLEALEDFTAIGNPINFVKSATVNFQTTIADGMLVYRCWVIYSRSWLTISLPLLLVLANVAIVGVLLYLEFTLRTTHALVNVKQLKPFGAAFWAITIVINVLTTTLIVVRIWRIHRNTKDFRYQGTHPTPRRLNTLQHVIRIIVESGLLYTGTSLVAFITYLTNGVAVAVTTDLLVQIIGISFNLIIIRAAQRVDQESSVTSQSRSEFPLRFMGTPANTFERPVQHIDISVVTEQESDKQGESVNDKNESVL
ncbi:hypothetical protein FB45DRAFT_1060327 [Roridomyces roridus]|uniref:Uncharacterized protein n=1 Tax=Roridomyces roridus TaxID=1738132 RepID=A0AAD7FIC0_9AGAR|nr:hypothetical protein FB45DRAFT_1060327 [Roridomyces roridus]